MFLHSTLKVELTDTVPAAERCSDASAFVALIFPVTVPLATWAVAGLVEPMRRLIDDPPRPDHASRTVLSPNQTALVEMTEAQASALAPGFDAGKTEGAYWGQKGARTVGLDALSGAVAAEEAGHWLTAALRALERAGAAPKTVTSQLEPLRRIEATQYLRGAAPWLKVTHLDPLANWITNNGPGGLAKEKKRVLQWSGNGAGVRELVEANLARQGIAPLNAAAVARVFKVQTAADAARAFDPLAAANVLRAAARQFGQLAARLESVGGPLVQLSRPA